MRIIIGIDGGGSGCRAIACNERGQYLGSGHSGPANMMTDFEGAKNNIIRASINALNDAKISSDELKNIDAFLGLAGANIGDLAMNMAHTLPFRRCQVETDAAISLEGAIGAKDGVVAIIGTGSVFISRINGKLQTIGGWGFMVGDLGGGARLGCALLQETLLVYDHIHSSSELTTHILHKFENNPQKITEYAHKAKPSEFATFAPLIFEYAQRHDPVARNILNQAVRNIEQTLETILGDNEHGFCMLGGLGAKYCTLINKNLARRLNMPIGNAVDGAVALALSRFSKENLLR